jgi:hypothetical protein
MKTLPSLLLVASVALLTLTGSSRPLASSVSEPARLVRTLELAQVGVSRPTGLGFSQQEGALLVLHAAGGSPRFEAGSARHR